jgi:tetratricopeptide (TPR) repeat protein
MSVDALERARWILDYLEKQAAGYTALTLPAHLALELEEQRKLVAELEHKMKPPQVVAPPEADFVGREQDLERIHAALKEPGARLGIVGPSGVGKSRLVDEYTRRYRQEYPGGIFWRSAVDSLLNHFAQLAKELNLVDQAASPQDAARKAWMYLDSRPDALLVFDNLARPDNLNRRLAPKLKSPAELSCRILFIPYVPSRGQLVCHFPLLEINVLEDQDVFNLLTARLDPALDRAVLWEVACKIGAILERNTLAMGLAARYIIERKISLQDYLEQLQAEGQTPAGRRAKAVVKALRVQWKGLEENDNARRLFRIAGQFPLAQPIPITWLELLSGLPLALVKSGLQALAKFQLVEMEQDDEINLHPLARDFAASLIPKDEEFRGELEAALVSILQAVSSDPQQANAAGDCWLALEWKDRKPPQGLVEALRGVVINEAASGHDRRQAGFTLLRMRWLDNVLDLPPQDLLVYLETLARSYISPSDLEYLMEKVSTLLKTPGLEERLQSALLVHRASFAARLTEAGKGEGWLEQARNDYEQARNILLSFGEAIQPEDYKYLARIFLGLGNIALAPIDQNEDREAVYQQLIQGPLSEEIWNSYQQAVQAVQAYGKDAALEAAVYQEFGYLQACRREWEAAQARYEQALEVLEQIKTSDLETFVIRRAHVLDKMTLLHWDHGDFLGTGPQALAEFCQGYEWACQEIEMLKDFPGKSQSLYRRLTLAHLNAADCLERLEEFKGQAGCPLPEPLSEACVHWHSAQEMGHEFAFADLEEAAEDCLNELCAS